MKNKSNIDLTEGDITKQLIAFIWPILLAALFQEAYNLSNSMIVGNYVSTEALSAVSACGSILNIFTYAFYGFATASGIVIANYYGSKQMDQLTKAIENILVYALLFALGITLISEIGTPALLKMSNISSEIYRDCEIYLRVYLLGSIAILTYNVAFFILRALGDSKHPLYYLITSVFLNIGMGMLFVKYFNMSVAGVALATVLSQFAVVLLSIRLLINMGLYKPSLRVKLDINIGKDIIRLGVPTAIQNMLVGLSTMLVQSYTNLFPAYAIAGVGVGQRVANWAQMPMQSITSVVTSFVGQNMGARKYERVNKGIQLCNLVATVITASCAIIIYLSAPSLVALFNQDPNVIKYGTEMTRWLVFSYIPLTWSHIYNGACRGAGNMKFPLIIAVCSQVIFRYLVVRIGFAMTFDIRIIYLSGAACFTLAGILATAYFNFGKWTKEHHLRP